MMQLLGAIYVTNINATYRRTGSLWEGRFKSSLVDSGSYCLACYRYFELNPVRAGMVLRPGDYRWSSLSTGSMHTSANFGTQPLDITPQFGVSEQKPDIDQSTLLTAL